MVKIFELLIISCKLQFQKDNFDKNLKVKARTLWVLANILNSSKLLRQ